MLLTDHPSANYHIAIASQSAGAVLFRTVIDKTDPKIRTWSVEQRYIGRASNVPVGAIRRVPTALYDVAEQVWNTDDMAVADAGVNKIVAALEAA